MARRNQLSFGASLSGVGNGPGDWRHPDADPTASNSLEAYLKQARLAEEAGFDFLFIADSLFSTHDSTPYYLNRFEPLTILSAIASATRRIGLVGTATATYSEPFNLARQFASLDHLSGGRAGWNLVTSYLEGSASNFSRDEHPEHDLRYEIADEFLAVTRGLWDSWEPDALIHDKVNGVYYDREKLHRLDHKGRFFSVRGPLNIARSPQGHPVLFQAGASDAGRAFAAANADAIFLNPATREEAIDHVADVRGRARAIGRDPHAIRFFPSMSPIIGADAADVERLHAEHAGLASLPAALALMQRIFSNVDLAALDPDALFPDIAAARYSGGQSSAIQIVQTARAAGQSLREAAIAFARPRGDFIGTPDTVADAVQHWFETDAADGFIITQPLPRSFRDFTELVVPILQRRGLFRTGYEAGTLRGHLGLSEPVNRHVGRDIVQARAYAERQRFVADPGALA